LYLVVWIKEKSQLYQRTLCIESKKRKEKGRKNAAGNIKIKGFFLSFFTRFSLITIIALSLSPLSKKNLFELANQMHLYGK
jgi:hypothetical protein